MNEQQLQHFIRETALTGGWKYNHFSDSRKDVGGGKMVGDPDAEGFPDLILIKDEQLLAWELKSEKGKLTDAQNDWLFAFENVQKVRSDVVRPRDQDYVLKTLLGGRIIGH